MVDNYLFWQTSDSLNYKPMLDLTAPHNKYYCDINGILYDNYVGIYRGHWPWQAAFNRIVKLNQLIDSGFEGWFIYADADSYVFDLNFDVKKYLHANSKYFFIAATGGDSRRLAINDGVFFINLSKSMAKSVVERWNQLFLERATDEYLKNQDVWGNDGINDQDLLHCVFGERHQELNDFIQVDDGSLINYRGSFIRQMLRSNYKEFDKRMDAIRVDIEQSRKNYSVANPT